MSCLVDGYSGMNNFMRLTYPPYREYFQLPATLSCSLVALITVQSFSVKSGNYSAGSIPCRVGEFSQKARAGYVREFFFRSRTFTTYSLQGEKTWVFPFAGETFIFLVKLYNEMFARAFHKGFSGS